MLNLGYLEILNKASTIKKVVKRLCNVMYFEIFGVLGQNSI